MAATAWQRARIRPANHPLVRPLPRQASSPRRHPVGVARDHAGNPDLEAGPVAGLRALALSHSGPGVGEDRALEMVASSLIPLALAMPAHSGRRHSPTRPPASGSVTPAPRSTPPRAAARQVAGSAPLGKIGARGAQGLLHLDTTLCQPRRCFECPIAAAELPSMADNRTVTVLWTRIVTFVHRKVQVPVAAIPAARRESTVVREFCSIFSSESQRR